MNHPPVSPSDEQAQGLSRRGLLKMGLSVGVAAGGGLMLGWSTTAAAASKVRPSPLQGDARLGRAGVFEPNAFIQIDRQGRVTLIMPKVEMGQGVYTSVPMLLAEELEVSLDAVTLQHAPPDAKRYSDPMLGGQVTGGSTSIRTLWVPMRQAGAAARTLLVGAAAQRWKVDPATCTARNGVVLHAASGRKLGYGDLVEAAAQLPVPEQVVLKDPRQFRLIGTPVKRLDSREKVNGQAVFGIDAKLPGMVHAAIVNSPVFGGTLATLDSTQTLAIQGVRQVVRLDNAVAVVADNTWAARQGAQALVLTWNEGAGAKVQSADLRADLQEALKKPGSVARQEGDVQKAFAGTAKRIEAVYEQPLLAHATMEPVNCTVHVRPDACELWTSSQVPTFAVGAAAKLTGLSEDKVVLHNHLLGGGFGRRLEVDYVVQAVKVAQQLKTPVKVLWSREEDIQHDLFRPMYLDQISAAVDAQGRPVAWQHRIAGSSVIARFFGGITGGIDPDAVEVARDIPYDVPHQRITYQQQEPRHVPTAFWRGVGPVRSTFVVESFIDELAQQAGTDPVAYRRSLLGKSPRALAVLERVAAESRWKAGAKPTPGRGRGVSVMHAFGTFMAVVADVSVNAQGEVKVNRIDCAVDCGMVVNPDTVVAQVQGGIIFGMTATLFSEITIKDGRVEQNNFYDYRMLRMNETPDIHVHLVRSSELPGGIGEPGTAVLGPALTNAIHAATGQRIRRLPVGTQLARSA